MISSHDEVRIAARAIVCQRTVSRVYQGKGTAYSRQRVTEAARALGLPEPSTPLEPSLPSESPPSSKAA